MKLKKVKLERGNSVDSDSSGQTTTSDNSNKENSNANMQVLESPIKADLQNAPMTPLSDMKFLKKALDLTSPYTGSALPGVEISTKQGEKFFSDVKVKGKNTNKMSLDELTHLLFPPFVESAPDGDFTPFNIDEIRSVITVSYDSNTQFLFDETELNGDSLFNQDIPGKMSSAAGASEL